VKNIYGARTHSGWLSFMYPRLLLAKDLLRDDGVIFISIDDNEQAQLKLLCDEVFGQENFISNLI
jgi:adenine-specific DNA-methyltransferase